MTCSFPIGDPVVPMQTFPVWSPARTGWICPKCQRGNSPDVMQCPSCTGLSFTVVVNTPA